MELIIGKNHKKLGLLGSRFFWSKFRNRVILQQKLEITQKILYYENEKGITSFNVDGNDATYGKCL